MFSCLVFSHVRRQLEISFVVEQVPQRFRRDGCRMFDRVIFVSRFCRLVCGRSWCCCVVALLQAEIFDRLPCGVSWRVVMFLGVCALSYLVLCVHVCFLRVGACVLLIRGL